MPGDNQNKRSQKSDSFIVRQSPLVASILGGSTAIIYTASQLSIKWVVIFSLWTMPLIAWIMACNYLIFLWVLWANMLILFGDSAGWPNSSKIVQCQQHICPNPHARSVHCFTFSHPPTLSLLPTTRALARTCGVRPGPPTAHIGAARSSLTHCKHTSWAHLPPACNTPPASLPLLYLLLKLLP